MIPVFIVLTSAAEDARLQELLDHQKKDAEAGIPRDQYYLGVRYLTGDGVERNPELGLRWIRAAATNQNKEFALSPALRKEVDATLRRLEGREPAQSSAGTESRPKRDKGQTISFTNLQGRAYQDIEVVKVEPDGIVYLSSDGIEAGKIKFADVPQSVQARFSYDPVRAAAYEREVEQARVVASLPRPLVMSQAEGKNFRRSSNQDPSKTRTDPGDSATSTPKFGTGTGFFVTDDGYLFTCHHVVNRAKRILAKTKDGILLAELIKVDADNDIALLKVYGSFASLPLAPRGSVKLGGPVFTIGYPNLLVQGQQPKYTDGKVSSLTGMQDDPSHFQISVPVQSGNSGGPLVDQMGNVVGMVDSRLRASATSLAPQNVNYALKSEWLVSFLETLPEVSLKLRKPHASTQQKNDDLIGDVQEATALVIVAY